MRFVTSMVIQYDIHSSLSFGVGVPTSATAQVLALPCNRVSCRTRTGDTLKSSMAPKTTVRHNGLRVVVSDMP